MDEDALRYFLYFVIYIALCVGNIFLFIFCEVKLNKGSKVDTGWFILAGIFWPLVYFAAMCMFLGKVFTSALVKFRKIVEEGEKE